MRCQSKSLIAVALLAAFVAVPASAQSTTAKPPAPAAPKKEAAAAAPAAACGDVSELLEAAKESGAKPASAAAKPAGKSSGKCEAGSDPAEQKPSATKGDDALHEGKKN
jgi:hypothetical protein